MEPLDTVIRGGTVATASDVFTSDIGIRNGKVVALGVDLPQGAREISSHGKLVLPGGIDGHCHLDQPLSDGAVMADIPMLAGFDCDITTAIPSGAVVGLNPAEKSLTVVR